MSHTRLGCLQQAAQIRHDVRQMIAGARQADTLGFNPTFYLRTARSHLKISQFWREQAKLVRS